jgi:hypothetical protein
MKVSQKERVLMHMFKRLALTVLLLTTGLSISAFPMSSHASAATTREGSPAISCPGITYYLGTVWDPGEYDSTTACDGGHLHLTYQSDGNFVLYCYGTALWATGTEGYSTSPDYVSFQYDGNLVVYETDIFTNIEYPGWASGTDNRGAVLVLQGDANLVIYNSVPQPIWASNTAGRC